MKLFTCLILLSALAVAAEPAVPAIPPAYATTATEVAPAGTTRPAAVVALHAHVRDRIVEAPTQWN